MNPWDPIIHSAPGSEIPVAAAMIRVDLPDNGEILWWAHLQAHLHGLVLLYQRLKDESQAYRTGRILARVQEANRKLFLGFSFAIDRASIRSAAGALQAFPHDRDPLPLESAWWAQAAFLAHAMASAYTFQGGMDDARAVLAGDALRGIRERVNCAFPPDVARDLLDLSTSTRWKGSETARAIAGMAGTDKGRQAPESSMEA